MILALIMFRLRASEDPVARYGGSMMIGATSCSPGSGLSLRF